MYYYLYVAHYYSKQSLDAAIFHTPKAITPFPLSNIPIYLYI